MAFDVARNLEPEWRDHRDGLSEAMRDYIERGRTVTAEEAEAGACAGRPVPLGASRACSAASTRCWSPACSARRRCGSEGHTGDPLLCRAWTFLGVPAISVPGLVGPAGMPVGVQLVGLDAESAVLARGGVGGAFAAGLANVNGGR